MNESREPQPERESPPGKELDESEAETIHGGLRLDGVNGESTDKTHKDWNDLNS